MAFGDDLLEALGGALGGGLGAMGMGALTDLLGLGGKETKQALPKRPAPKLDMPAIQAPTPPPVPFQPPPIPGGQGAAGGVATPLTQQALQKAMNMMVRGGR
jgi:hypothetical protein